MDKITSYRKIVRQFILGYAQDNQRNSEVRTEVLVDTERDHYKVMDIGFQSVS
ncbi:MAG: XisI protein [Blastocatellia bacterium]|nr:XisI protein [Blastocatellia bacterium]